MDSEPQTQSLPGSAVAHLHPDQGPQWDAFVAKHPWGTIYHTTGWKRVLEKSFPHIKGCLLALLNEGRIQAGWPVYTVKSWILGNRLVSIPFASVCDPLVFSPGEPDVLLAEIRKLHNHFFARTTELKTLHAPHLINESSLGVRRFYKYHSIPLQEHAGAVRKTFSRTGVQRVLTNAVKAGLTVQCRHTEQDLKTFYNLLTQSRQRLSLPPLPYHLFVNLLEEFGSKHTDILLAYHDGQPVGGLFNLKFNGTYAAEFSGDLAAFRELGVNHLLYWESIKKACSEGCRAFSFGRTSSHNAGLLAFKRRWGTTESDLPLYIYPASALKPAPTSESSIASKLIRWLSGHAPAPLYHLIGRICYSHWA